MGEPRYTEKEMVMAQRDAFVRGRRAMCTSGDAPTIAANLFPLPKVERPRVVTDKRGVEWQVRDGMLRWRYAGHEEDWKIGDSDVYSNVGMHVTAERIRLLADLLARPSELVDDEG